MICHLPPIWAQNLFGVIVALWLSFRRESFALDSNMLQKCSPQLLTKTQKLNRQTYELIDKSETIHIAKTHIYKHNISIHYIHTNKKK